MTAPVRRDYGPQGCAHRSVGALGLLAALALCWKAVRR